MNKRQRKKAYTKQIKQLREARLNFNRARQEALKAHTLDALSKLEIITKPDDFQGLIKVKPSLIGIIHFGDD